MFSSVLRLLLNTPGKGVGAVLLAVPCLSVSAVAQRPKAATQPKITTSPQAASSQVKRPGQTQYAAAMHRPFRAHYSYGGDYIQPHDSRGSTYIPVDSWMYPALTRLYALGYLDSAFLGLRPWTRRSVLHMLQASESDIVFDENEEAVDLLAKLEDALTAEPDPYDRDSSSAVVGVESAYAGARITGGTVLRDSYHLGQSFQNDYGRPYSNGVNSYDGVSALAEKGRFSLYVRGEYQHAPEYSGYSADLAQKLSNLDAIPYTGANSVQATIPEGPVASQNKFRLLEANASAHVLGHEFSFGKSDAWLGPAMGGGMAWSNNAENLYSFRINRVEPLYVPVLSRIVGRMRYDFFVGSLKGHTAPNSPWVHAETISFAPSRNLQFGFERTVIWGGKDHSPITFGSFFRSFFHVSNVSTEEKFSRDDPGARFGSFFFSYRLPMLRRSVMLYTDSITHDDPSPIAAPRRAGWRPGVYIAHLPHAPKMDLRVEGSYTDFVTTRSLAGQGNYFEQVQRQGYTNNGFLMGDWMGREGKGGQAWLTYHLSGNEWVSAQYLRKKNAKDFIDGGTTQNAIRVDVVKRLRPDVELSAWVQYEQWKAPIFKTGSQSDTTGSFQVKWYPRLGSGLKSAAHATTQMPWRSPGQP